MVALVIGLVLLVAGPVQAMTPTETVQTQVDAALRTVGQAPGGTPAAAEQRRNEIRRVADVLFDGVTVGAYGDVLPGMTSTRIADVLAGFTPSSICISVGRGASTAYPGKP